MAELKTKKNDGDVDEFIRSIDNEVRRRDAFTVKEMMTRLSGEEPTMWGSSIVGFGTYRYTPGSGGAEREWMKVGFSPRKQSLTLYIMDGFDGYGPLLEQLGPHSTGVSCLYIKDLEKVDKAVVEDLITRSLDHIDRVVDEGFEGTMPVG